MMYQEMIRQVMYRAWNQPSSVAVEGLTTKMAITFGPGGTITGSRMTESSGNGVMDESVRRAVESVGRISELPPSFIEQHGTVIVAFELTGNGG
jgi:TonB family protein